MADDAALIEKLAEVIAENVGVAYSFRPDGTIDPETIRVHAHGAAYAALAMVRAQAAE